MTLDRSDSNIFTVTQETIGKLLGVRRESVTQILGLFQKDQLIERARGRITVLDRGKLEKRVTAVWQAGLKEIDLARWTEGASTERVFLVVDAIEFEQVFRRFNF